MKIKQFVMSVLLALSVGIVGLPLKVPGTSLSVSAVSEAQAQRRYRSYRPYYRPYYRPRYRPAPRYYRPRYRPPYRPAPRYYRPAPRYGCNYRACSARYRSFDPRSCTYQPYNGPRRRCRL